MKIFLDANICLDLLDTKRPNSTQSIAWYMQHKDNESLEFYFSADFITTLFYILTQKSKHSAKNVLEAIDALSFEITPHYLLHSDFLAAKESFYQEILDDFEDLMVVQSAVRLGCERFITYDKELLRLKRFETIEIQSPM
ncbi:MAG: type II toxin-antitoxin system VapC family toxin [Campylobacterales bacterium]|nr:type II toxin-antitoxin system VapC family toxin [Campylobacterales bacterium]